MKLDQIRLTVNGKRHRLRIDPGETLLDVLRTRLALTGTKKGCGAGQCGACTVIVDGRAVNACLVLAARCHGTSVTTIEGLGTSERLHPLQEAFLDHAAVQCGYCTPGALMAAKALLDANTFPTRQEIREALSGVLCRCTGYGPIIEAIEAVAREPRSGPAPVRRLDGVEKVLGATRFAGDLRFPGMLHARALRSSIPHGRVISIRTDLARAATGVAAILTAQDLPGAARAGSPPGGQPVLVPVGESVHMVGDPLALVAAATEAAAEAALELIHVEYEELPALASPQEALAAGASPLYSGKADNVCARLSQSRGDLEQGIAPGHAVVDRLYRTPIQEHAFLEPEVAVAVPGPRGRLSLRRAEALGHAAEGPIPPAEELGPRDSSITIYCPTQSPFPARKTVAEVLGWPEERVRIVTTTAGGAFGGKADLHAQAHAALLAVKLRRPVRIEWTREESMVAHAKRHPLHLHARLAADGEGRLMALEATAVGDAGPYTGPSPLALFMTLSSMAGAYHIPHIRCQGVMAFTNNPNSGLLRGMGGLPANTLRESLLDELARRLGMDPVELRRRNLLAQGDRPAFPGVVLHGRVTAGEVMDRALEAAGRLAPSSKASRSVGRGLCLAMPPFQIAAPPRSASARVEMVEDGSAVAYAGVSEMGNGVTTSLAQMVAGDLGLQTQQVRVVFGDTARCPAGTPAVGSGQTYTTGNALRLATLDLKTRLVEAASQLLEAPAAILRFEKGYIMVAEAPGRRTSLAQAARACREAGTSPAGQATFSASHAAWGHTFACTVADVEADRETGDVTVLQVVSALDTGPVINRQNVLGQMQGAAVQSQGFVTMEEFLVEKAIPLTRGLHHYRIPTMMDIPAAFTAVTVEEPYPTGPYGAKGVGEHGVYTVGPAILCAIENALGVRLEGFPATPERVLRVVKELTVQGRGVSSGGQIPNGQRMGGAGFPTDYGDNG